MVVPSLHPACETCSELRHTPLCRPRTWCDRTCSSPMPLVIRDNKLYGLCVVDDEGDLIGILTIKDLIEALFTLSAVAQGREPQLPPA